MHKPNFRLPVIGRQVDAEAKRFRTFVHGLGLKMRENFLFDWPIMAKKLVLQQLLVAIQTGQLKKDYTICSVMYGNGWIIGSMKRNSFMRCAGVRGTTMLMLCAAPPGSTTFRGVGGNVVGFRVNRSSPFFPEFLILCSLEL